MAPPRHVYHYSSIVSAAVPAAFPFRQAGSSRTGLLPPGRRPAFFRKCAAGRSVLFEFVHVVAARRFADVLDVWMTAVLDDAVAEFKADHRTEPGIKLIPVRNDLGKRPFCLPAASSLMFLAISSAFAIPSALFVPGRAPAGYRSS